MSRLGCLSVWRKAVNGIKESLKLKHTVKLVPHMHDYSKGCKDSENVSLALIAIITIMGCTENLPIESPHSKRAK